MGRAGPPPTRARPVHVPRVDSRTRRAFAAPLRAHADRALRRLHQCRYRDRGVRRIPRPLARRVDRSPATAITRQGGADDTRCPPPVCVGDGVVLPPGSPPSLALPSTATPAVPPRVTPERRSVDGQSTFREYPGELVGLVAAPARRTELAREERDRLLLADFLRLVSWQLRENSAERFDAFHSEAHLRSSVASSPVLADRSGDVARRLRRRSVSCCRIRVRSLQPEWFERRARLRSDYTSDSRPRNHSTKCSINAFAARIVIETTSRSLT